MSLIFEELCKVRLSVAALSVAAPANLNICIEI